MKNVDSLYEVVYPILYCTCSDLGPQSMIGLCLRSRRMENRSRVASHCIILEFLDFLDLLHFNPFL
jgi:hypothetical protein